MNTGVSEDLRIMVTIVDDGSTDETHVICNKLLSQYPRLLLVRHPVNRGYGSALRSGFKAVESAYVGIMDSDGQFDAKDLMAFFKVAENCDIVAGYRSPRADPWGRRCLGVIWTWIGRILFHIPLKDLNCGLKIIRRSILSEIDLISQGPGINLDIMSQVTTKGLRVRQLPCHHRPRPIGEQTGGSSRVILRAVPELIRILKRKLIL